MMMFYFQVLAVEIISPTITFTASTRVQIQLTDINDNSPVFQQAEYEFEVLEDREVGAVIGKVRTEYIHKLNLLKH